MCMYWNTLKTQCTFIYDILNVLWFLYSCYWWGSGGFVVDHFTCDVYCLSNEEEGRRKLPAGRTEVHKLFIHEGPRQGILCMIHWLYSTSFQNTLELESFLHHLSWSFSDQNLSLNVPSSSLWTIAFSSSSPKPLGQFQSLSLEAGGKVGPQCHTFYKNHSKSSSLLGTQC